MDGKILDIGTSMGGNYINKDMPETMRVGLDMRQTLIRAVNKYNIAGCFADADVSEGKALPFATGSFSRVEMYMPHNSLFLQLVDEQSVLWKEINRILIPNGKVKVVFDVRIDDTEPYRYVKEDELQKVAFPHKKIELAAEKAGFLTELIAVSDNDIRKYKIEFTNTIVNRVRRGKRQPGGPDTAIYELYAYKSNDSSA